MKILGIDNGLDGALFQIESDMNGNQVTTHNVMPVIDGGKKREYDVNAITNFISNLRPDHAFLEKAQAMPGQGVSSMFSIGLGYGIVRGVLSALKIPYTLVHPKTWQKEMFRDCPKDDTKAQSVIVAKRLFPQLDFLATPRCRVAHDGLTDAALIATYGKRVLAH